MVKHNLDQEEDNVEEEGDVDKEQLDPIDVSYEESNEEVDHPNDVADNEIDIDDIDDEYITKNDFDDDVDMSDPFNDRDSGPDDDTYE